VVRLPSNLPLWGLGAAVRIPPEDSPACNFPTELTAHMSSLFLRNLAEHHEMTAALPALDAAIQIGGLKLAQVLASGGKLMFCGNGGSAADSQHLASELTGRFIKDRRPLAGIALSTDSSALTCIGNDYAFEQVFARQLTALARPGDGLVAISTSGNSANVLRAVEAAREAGVFTLGLLGRDGGRLAEACDATIIVRHTVTARIQEAHILIGHTLCGIIEAELGLA
jgi:D-sedoheptulose 7-phosphate isomerase